MYSPFGTVPWKCRRPWSRTRRPIRPARRAHPAASRWRPGHRRRARRRPITVPCTQPVFRAVASTMSPRAPVCGGQIDDAPMPLSRHAEPTREGVAASRPKSAQGSGRLVPVGGEQNADQVLRVDRHHHARLCERARQVVGLGDEAVRHALRLPEPEPAEEIVGLLAGASAPADADAPRRRTRDLVRRPRAGRRRWCTRRRRGSRRCRRCC